MVSRELVETVAVFSDAGDGLLGDFGDRRGFQQVTFNNACHGIGLGCSDITVGESCNVNICQ